MTRYYRSKDGTTVHLPTCHRIGERAKPWYWADDKSDALIAVKMAEFGIRPCRLCYPPLFPTRAHLRVVNGE